MADAVVSRLGQVNGAGDAEALFLKVYAGEVLSAFYAKTVFLDKHIIRTIESGKSASFPVTGKSTAEYHTPGTEILGDVVKANERLVTIDQMLIAPRTIALIDEAMNHYDVRSIYSMDAGKALAIAFDKHVAQVGVLAARAAATVTGEDGGSKLTAADMDTNATTLAAGIFSAGQKFDEKNIDEDERYCYLKPAQYNLLAQTTSLFSTLFKGQGSIAEGNILKYGGFTLVKTNNLPTTNIAAGPLAYQGDFTKTIALCMTKAAVGTVKLIDLAVESQWDIRRQVTLVLAKYAMGHGILRPECSVELALT